MSKKLLDRAEKEKEKRRPMYVQGDVVFAKYLSLWSKGIYIQHNKDGTLKVRLGRNRVNLRSYDVQPIKRDTD